ncbi:MAG: MCP four helix bundle domain-containing protein [Anaerolineales bacterium]|nr:MCP four helix bundle domain-containing protein [Anaerolineales bacterium]
MNVLNNMEDKCEVDRQFFVHRRDHSRRWSAGVYYLKQIDAADTRLYQNQTVPIGQIADAGVAFQRIRVNLRDMILAKDTTEAQKYADTIKELDALIVTTSADYEKLIVSTEMQTLFDEYMTSYEEFNGYRDQIMALALAGKPDEALTTLRGDAFASAKSVEEDLDAMQQMKVEQAKGVPKRILPLQIRQPRS